MEPWRELLVRQPARAGLIVLLLVALTSVAHAQQAGSGTSWLPAVTPMYAVHRQGGDWTVMLHGSVFAQYLEETSDRGDAQSGSINWFMAMAERTAGRGRFGLHAMFSVEPWTIGGCGYPDLLATGERCDRESIVDRQHPHDLLMELAARYERPIGPTVSVQLYGGPAGEPALGPVAFPHRLSAMPNPLAPISHHWLDATHITFGVVTGALYGATWKVEGSLFNGREPDENRTDVDLAALDSVSGRFSYLPSDRWAIQVSAGHLRDAEPAHDSSEPVDVGRVTASATHHRRLLDDTGFWASTLAWGRNEEDGEGSNFVLAETSFTLHDRDAWFGRLDLGQKSAHDLEVRDADELFTVGKLQGGYVRYVSTLGWLQAGIGTTVSASFVPRGLRDVYGGRTSLGWGVFLNLRPAAMGEDPHAGHQMP